MQFDYNRGEWKMQEENAGNRKRGDSFADMNT
jgi:hypothetical protein